jgi:hypothetical protein
MANPTTNYGFVLPTSTDLVTDLPADFDVALQGVDTRLKALQPGTTLGDLAYSSATANTNTRLGIGTTGQILTVAGGVPAWATPAASSQKVVQIIAATHSSGVSNSTTTYADTGLTATITPTSASNKILVIWSQGGLQKTATNASSELELQLLRGATQIATGYAGLTATALNNNPGNVGAAILDSPATTSATTYKSQFRNGVNAASVVCQYNSGTSSLVLMEVTP